MSGSDNNPYVGPPPFLEQDKERFFGRDEEISILEGLILARRAVLLYAASGAGKSSLLNAGLIPSLTRERKVGYGRRQHAYCQMRVLPVLRVGGAIPKGVYEQNVKNIFVYNALLMLHSKTGDSPDAQDRSRWAGMSLTDGLSGLLPVQQTDDTRLEGKPSPDTLLVFDQFEELFTRHTDRWSHREGFFKQVRCALNRYPSLRVLFSMREDYIAELTPFAGLLPDELRSRFRLERLRERAALEAIRLPAKKAGREFEEGAAELLVRLLRTNPAEQVDAALKVTVPDEPDLEFVEPMHLQIVCRRLWTKLAADRQTISVQDAQELGDVEEALTEFYDKDAIADIVGRTRSRDRADLRASSASLGLHRTPASESSDPLASLDSPVSELRLRTWFDRQLITPARTRSLVYRDAEHTGRIPNAVVDVLDYKVHIIRPVVRGKDTWYELSHDRLVDPIIQSNHAWLERHAAPWQLQAQRWLDDGEPADRLLGREELDKARQWIDEQGYEEKAHELRFLDASKEGLARAQKQSDLQSQKRLNLAETGWGVIFGRDDPRASAIESALSELLAHRSGQAGERYRVFSGDRGYRSDRGAGSPETAQAFLTRFGVGPGVTNYERVPYHLLIVGDPQQIPFEFQYALQSQYYAVGRLDFPELAEYASYARSVVQSENGSFSLMPTMALFGPQSEQDSATTEALKELFEPLLGMLSATQLVRDWQVGAVLRDEATKERLSDLLGGQGAPALLFSASFGASAPYGDVEQEDIQGGIMCQVDPTPWPGVKPASPDQYFAARDVGDEARLLGSIVFLFGGWSAGTPHLDNFPPSRKRPEPLAPRPFVARLPQRLLGHPKGGVLAVIGHVDQGWTHSFSWEGVDLASDHFGGTLRRLMEGYSVGAAMEPIVQRAIQLSSMLAEELQQVFFYGGKDGGTDLDRLNHCSVDARNYIILGDPAARLPLENGPVFEERLTIETVAIKEGLVLSEPETTIEPRDSSAELTPELQVEQRAEDRLPAEEVIGEVLSEWAWQAERLYFNGVDGSTGGYRTPPMTAEELARFIKGEAPEENLELRYLYRRRTARDL